MEFLYFANSHILYMSPYTSGDHHDVGSVCLYNSWGETMCLTFVRSKWKRDLESGTGNREGMYCSNDKLFPLNAALNICTSSVLVIFLVYFLHSFDFLLPTMSAKCIIWFQSLCHVIKL